MIRNLPEGTKAALRVRAARHHHSVEAEARAILTAGLLGEEVPMPVLLAADSGHDIDFEPERLGLIARTPQLCPTSWTPTWCPLCACRDATPPWRRGRTRCKSPNSSLWR